MKNALFATFTTATVLLAPALFGGVFDDAIWMMQPEDRNGNGLIDSDETVNWLKGGDLKDNTHKCYVYGYDDNRKMEQVTINSRYLSGYTTTAMLITDANTQVKDGKTYYYPGAIVMNTAVPGLIDTTATSFSAIVRCCPQDANSNTRWALQCGNNANRGFTLGFVGDHVRVYSGGDKGNVASGKSYIGALPVTANEWVDLGITVSWKPELVDGALVTTGRLHVVLAKVGSDKLLTDDSFTNHNMIPDGSTVRIGVETAVTSETTDAPNAKRFKGHIHQVALWNRALTDDEFVEAFKFAAPTHGLVGRNDGTANEFTSKSATSVDLDAPWHEIPKTLPDGTTWTMKITSDKTCARLLKVKPLSGTTKLVARDMDGNEKAAADVTSLDETTLFLPRDTFSTDAAGRLQFKLSGVGGDLTLDSLALIDDATRTARVDYDADTTVSQATDVPIDNALEIYVAEGKTVVYSGVISGGGKVIKTGLGTLEMTAANTVSGGFTVNEGYLKGVPGDTTAVFGTGTVTVNATGDRPSQAIIAGTFANTFAFTGTSNDDYPALHFADTTTLNGCTETVNGTNAAIRAANAVVYLTTAWDDTIANADANQIVISETIFAEGGTIAMAPHCRVTVSKPITCALLRLYWRPNSASADGGNPGVVWLPTHGDRKNGPKTAVQCNMRKVEIDQTRIVQSGQNIFGSSNGYQSDWPCADIEWTGEHKTGGSIDSRSLKMNFGKVIAPPTDADDRTSMRIFSSLDTAMPYINFLDTISDGQNIGACYLQFEGRIRAALTTGSYSGGTAITLINRHHTCECIDTSSSKVYVSDGTTLSPKVSFVNSSGTVTFQNLTKAKALQMNSLTTSATGKLIFDESAAAALSTDYSLVVTQYVGKYVTYTLPVGTVWKVKSFTVKGVPLPAGEYHTGDAALSDVSLPNTITLQVSTTGKQEAELDPVHWDGEAWVDENSQSPALYLARRAATCESADGAVSLPGSAFFSDLLLNKIGGGTLTLSAAADAVLNISGTLTLGETANYVITPSTTIGGPIIIDGGRTLTFENDVVFNDTVLVSNKTLAVGGEASGSGRIIMATGTNPELKLDGAEIRVPINVGNKSAQGNFLLTATGSTLTNYFHGKLSDKGSTYVFLTEGYTYVFDGGFAMAGKHAFRISGLGEDDDSKGATIILSGTGNTIDWRTDDGWFTCGNGNHLILDFANADGRLIEVPLANGVVEFRQDDFYPLSKAQVYDRAAMNVNGTFLLNSTHQYASNLRGSGVIDGAEGAELEIARGTNYTFKGSFTGAAGLTMNGVTQAISGVSTSTGAITVKKGILTFTGNAKWENATAVNVEGGTLALDVRKPFGADTPFNVLPGGTVQLTKRVSVTQAAYDGEKLPDGTYGTIGSGAEHEVGWITGTGRLRVGNLGLVILVR